MTASTFAAAKVAADRVQFGVGCVGHDVAMVIEPSRHFEHEAARHQRRFLLQQEAERTRQLRAADLQHTPIATRHDESELCTAPLNDRVEGERGAVHHQFDIGWRDAGALDQRRKAALDRERRIGRDARFLVAHQTAADAVGQYEVCEGAADVDADATRHQVRSSPSPCGRGLGEGPRVISAAPSPTPLPQGEGELSSAARNRRVAADGSVRSSVIARPALPVMPGTAASNTSRRTSCRTALGNA